MKSRVWRLLTAPLRWLAALARWLWRSPIGRPVRWLWGRWRAVVTFFTEVPEDVALTDTLGDALGSRQAFQELLGGFGEHLEALRLHLLRAVLVLVLTTAFSFSFANQIMAVLAVPLTDRGVEQVYGVLRAPPLEAVARLMELGATGLDRLQVIEPTEAVGVFMRVSLLAGLSLAMPWIVIELYLFIAPGLMPRSRLMLFLGLPAATVLFLMGISFTFFVMLPAAIPFLYSFAGFQAAWRPSAYFNLVTGLMFWIGIAFQMPLLVYALAAAGLVQAKQLIEHWRVAVIAVAFIAAAVTPTVDPVNMLLVMAPMMALYGFSILGAAVAGAARRREIQQRRAQMEPVR